jgi:MFS family permease
MIHCMQKHDAPMTRIAISSFVGSAIEFYDFFIYGTAAALVFPHVFFPNLGTTMATVASLGAFAAAFLSRPVGAAVFGHFGDRLGRKRTLVATLLIMGLSTVLVGLIPGTATIGLAAPLLLVGLRILQGFAVGGEWAGSALLSAEYAPTAKRGFYGMFTQLGLGAALVLANLVFLLVQLGFGTHNAAFLAWGWRIPFLLSGVLIAVALYMRLNIAETPVFADEHDPDAKAPIAELLTRQPLQIALASGAVVGIFTLAHMAGTYLANYAATELGYARGFILLVGVLGGLATLVCTAFTAILSDTFGRKRFVVAGFGLAVPWSFAVMPLVDSGDPKLFGLAVVVTYALIGTASGPMATFLPEMFATRYRYTGSGLAYNVGGILGGAVPPLVASALLSSFGGWAIGLMMAGLAALSLVCVLRLPETMGKPLTASPVRVAPALQPA